MDEGHRDVLLKAPFGAGLILKALFQNRNMEVLSYNQLVVNFPWWISDQLKIVADPTNWAASVFHFIFLGLDEWNGKAGKIEIPLLRFSPVLCVIEFKIIL